MEKSQKASVCIFIILVAFCLSIFAMYVVNQYDQMHMYHGPGQETVFLDFQSITKSNGYYNISLAINVLAPQSLDKLVIGPMNNTAGSIITSKEEVNSLNMSLNGTAVDTAADMAKQLNYHLNSGDCVQVNFRLPCTEYSSNSTIGVDVFTSQAMYFQEMGLP
jgi:hypothetical protein